MGPDIKTCPDMKLKYTTKNIIGFIFTSSSLSPYNQPGFQEMNICFDRTLNFKSSPIKYIGLIIDFFSEKNHYLGTWNTPADFVVCRERN